MIVKRHLGPLQKVSPLSKCRVLPSAKRNCTITSPSHSCVLSPTGHFLYGFAYFGHFKPMDSHNNGFLYLASFSWHIFKFHPWKYTLFLLWLNNVPSYEYITFCLSGNRNLVSTFWLLPVMLLRTFMYKFSILLGRFLGGNVLSHGNSMLQFLRSCQTISTAAVPL